MAYLDRGYNDIDSGDRGRFARFFARVVENPENPLGWSMKMFTVDGITTRIHLVTIVYFVAMLLSSLAWGNIGFAFMAIAMTSLFVVVLLHEFGHCYACRWVGGEADRIVMLPFGGLALTAPPNEWKPYFITAAGGPLINLLIFPLTALGLLLIGRPDTIATFNPFDPGFVVASFRGTNTFTAYAKVALWWLHYTNIVIFAFNVFLPMFPLDGGRMVQGLLWKRKGYVAATNMAVITGFAGAIVLGVFAAVAGRTLLLAIAIFGGWACYVERKRLFADEELAAAGYARVGDFDASAPSEPDEPSRAELKRRERAEREQAELDRILAKISDHGMASLTRREKATLARMSKNKRSD